MRYANLRRMFVLLGVAVLALGSVTCASKPSGPEAYVDKRVSELKELVAKEVKDPGRVQDLTAVLDHFDQEFNAQTKVVARLQKDLREAARRYDATDEELEMILSELRGEGLKLTEVFEMGHHDLRELVTQEEWTSIVNHQRKILGIF